MSEFETKNVTTGSVRIIIGARIAGRTILRI